MVKPEAIVALLAALFALGLGAPQSVRSKRQWVFPGETTESRPTGRRQTTRRTSSSQTAAPSGTAGALPSTTQSSATLFNLENCPCPTTSQYQPACGSDGNTYSNPAKIKCAIRCGYQVELVRLSLCTFKS